MTSILVIDDDPFTHALARLWLSGGGCFIESASTIWDGLARTMDFPPDVVLLDIGMPDFSGLDLLELVRERNSWTDTKVIVITGSQEKADRFQAASMCIHAFLQKHLSGASLIAAIRPAQVN